MNKLLHQALKAAHRIAKKSNIPHVLLERDEEKLRIVATDGVALLQVDIPRERGAYERTVIDAATCAELADHVKHGGELRLPPNDDDLFFPPYQKVMPTGEREACDTLGIDAVKLSEAAKVVGDMVMATGRFKRKLVPVRMSIGGAREPVELSSEIDEVHVRYVLMPLRG